MFNDTCVVSKLHVCCGHFTRVSFLPLMGELEGGCWGFGNRALAIVYCLLTIFVSFL